MRVCRAAAQFDVRLADVAAVRAFVFRESVCTLSVRTVFVYSFAVHEVTKCLLIWGPRLEAVVGGTKLFFLWAFPYVPVPLLLLTHLLLCSASLHRSSEAFHNTSMTENWKLGEINGRWHSGSA